MLSNVRSIRKHHEDLETLIGSLESPPSICITETWLSDDDNPDCYAIKGYKPYAAANRSTRCGGSMIQLHNNVNILKQLSTNLPESSAVLVDFFGNRIVVVVIYAKLQNCETTASTE